MPPHPPLHLGFAKNPIPVPLFVELYGYGPFLGRRNLGVRDPLHCRAASFRSGAERAIALVSDLVTMDPDRCWEVRGEIGRRLRMASTNVMVSGTHTHSGPTISKGIGWGELDPVFVEGWKAVAVETAVEAAADESPVGMRLGRAPLSQLLGVNRFEAGGPTDPDIRWAAFGDERGTKLLLHNHGMHGVVFGKEMRLVSADWMGEANRLVEERGLARNAAFLYGAAGQINTSPCCKNLEEGEPELRRIGRAYVEDLERGLAGGEAAAATPVAARMERFEVPYEAVSPAELRRDAQRMREIGGRQYVIDRMEEMALWLEAGNRPQDTADLQALRVGDLYLYAFPGEPFLELGKEVERRSPGFAMPVAVANDNQRYIPTLRAFEENPEVVVANKGYGYYETRFAGFGRFRPSFKPEIGDLMVGALLGMGERLAQAEPDKEAPTQQ